VGEAGPFVAQTAERMARHLQTNLHAPLELTRQVLPGMLERGRGTIAAVSSISGELAFRNVATYSASKAGLSQFVVDLRRELGRTPVRTLLVILGEVETQMIQEGRADPVLAAVARRLSKLKSLDPADVAAATLDAVERGRRTLVMPPLLRPAYAMRQFPNRFTDLAMAGIE
jgi:short-subunit dehydrogenase